MLVNSPLSLVAAFQALRDFVPHSMADLPCAAQSLGIADGADLSEFPLVPVDGKLYAMRPLDAATAPTVGDICAFCLLENDTATSFWFGPMMEADELHALRNDLPGDLELEIIAVAFGIIAPRPS